MHPRGNMTPDRKNLINLVNSNWQLPEPLDVPVFKNAACAGLPTEWWFPEKDGGGQTRRTTAKAIQICNSCDEQRKCADFAIDNPSVHGIWGGLSVKRRSRARTVIQRANLMERAHIHPPYSEMRKRIESGPRGPLSI